MLFLMSNPHSSKYLLQLIISLPLPAKGIRIKSLGLLLAVIIRLHNLIFK